MQIPYDNRDWTKKFDQIHFLKWYPWVGSAYSGILIVGESNFDGWKDVDSETSALWLADKNFTRNRMFGPAMNGDPTAKIYRNLERSVYGASSIELEKCQSFWNRAAYFNLVQRVMPTIEHRPDRSDYKQGWDVYWEIRKILKPRLSIILGTDLPKIQTFRQLLLKHEITNVTEVESSLPLGSRTHGLAFTIAGDSKDAIVFIKHPSSYFSWENCNKFFSEIGIESQLL